MKVGASLLCKFLIGTLPKSESAASVYEVVVVVMVVVVVVLCWAAVGSQLMNVTCLSRAKEINYCKFITSYESSSNI